jgi:hypothetical protein
MTTKEEYEKALKEMNDAFYGITFLNSQTRRFDDNLNLLRELVNEHFEEKKESNLEHYKEEIKSAGYDFALVNGKPTTCKWILCDQCFFNDRILCAKKRIEWMLKPFKRKYKLTQFEYDLLQSYASGYKFKDIMPLIVMKEKGYFKDINKDEKITDILWNCGVIKND